VALGNGNDSVNLARGWDTFALGNGYDQVSAGNGNDKMTVGIENNFLVGGLGPHAMTAGNGINILIDGSATFANPGDSFRQILGAWVENPVRSNQAPIQARFTVNYNAQYANTLSAGSGIDWFFYKNPPTTSNKKPTDFWTSN
jgi:Ca2+-binding RTX toxin-like protein